MIWVRCKCQAQLTHQSKVQKNMIHYPVNTTVLINFHQSLKKKTKIGSEMTCNLKAPCLVVLILKEAILPVSLLK